MIKVKTQQRSVTAAAVCCRFVQCQLVERLRVSIQDVELLHCAEIPRNAAKGSREA